MLVVSDKARRQACADHRGTGTVRQFTGRAAGGVSFWRCSSVKEAALAACRRCREPVMGAHQCSPMAQWVALPDCPGCAPSPFEHLLTNPPQLRGLDDLTIMRPALPLLCVCFPDAAVSALGSVAPGSFHCSMRRWHGTGTRGSECGRTRRATARRRLRPRRSRRAEPLP